MHVRFRARALCAAAIAVLAAGGFATVGGRAVVRNSTSTTFTVTSNLDTSGTSCAAVCTLRQAVGAYNALAGSPGDTARITFDLTQVTAPIVLTSNTQLSLNNTTVALTIDGLGKIVVDGNANSTTIFNVSPGVTAAINNITLQNGGDAGGSMQPEGRGGAILNAGTLSLDRDTIKKNALIGFLTHGTAIDSDGDLTITNSTISDNQAMGLVSVGGAIRTIDGVLTMSNDVVKNNVEECFFGAGGGIGIGGPAAHISSTTVTNNTVASLGIPLELINPVPYNITAAGGGIAIAPGLIGSSGQTEVTAGEYLIDNHSALTNNKVVNLFGFFASSGPPSPLTARAHALAPQGKVSAAQLQTMGQILARPDIKPYATAFQAPSRNAAAPKSQSPQSSQSTVILLPGPSALYAGGGLAAGVESLTLVQDTVISGNLADATPFAPIQQLNVLLDAAGGGVAVATPAILLMERSTVAKNAAKGADGFFTDDRGGGVYSQSSGPVVLSNVTVSDNTAGSDVTDTAGWGGGVFLDTVPSRQRLAPTKVAAPFRALVDGKAANLIMDFSTLGTNVASTGSGLVVNAPGQLSQSPQPTAEIDSSILNDTATTECDNVSGTPSNLLSLGHNIDSGVTCKFGQATDKNSTNANLAALAPDAQSPLPTRAINASSPAFDAAGTTCAVTTDERGVTRPKSVACDIGAYEFIPPPPPPPTIPTNPGGGQQPIGVTIPNTGGATANVGWAALAFFAVGAAALFGARRRRSG